MPFSEATLCAKKLLEEIGIVDLTTIDIEDLVWARGAVLRFLPMINADGRIVFSDNGAIITINSQIEYKGRRRFTIAHELGHYEMHRSLFQYHNDDLMTLDWYKDGYQETEANQFASELLMPEHLFRAECRGKKFSPELLRYLAERFQTSITSSVYKYFELGDHPICLFYSHNNKIRYWKRPENYPHFINDRTKLPPPEDSVAAEFFNDHKIYSKEHSKQQIWKSTWFELKSWENDNDFRFYEYCIVTPIYNTVLSIVWEELK